MTDAEIDKILARECRLHSGRMRIAVAVCTDWLKREGEHNKHAPAVQDLLQWAKDQFRHG